MNSFPERLLDDLATERINERRRSCPGAPPPSPRTPPARRRAAGALRRFADRLDGGD
jgi:hypothetical protein